MVLPTLPVNVRARRATGSGWKAGLIAGLPAVLINSGLTAGVAVVVNDCVTKPMFALPERWFLVIDAFMKPNWLVPTARKIPSPSSGVVAFSPLPLISV